MTNQLGSKKILKNNNNESPLFYSICRDDFSIARLLISRGANINYLNLKIKNFGGDFPIK